MLNRESNQALNENFHCCNKEISISGISNQDYSLFHEIYSDPRAMEFIAQPLKRDEIRKRFEEIKSQAEDSPVKSLWGTISLRKPKDQIGLIGFTHLNSIVNGAQLGIILRPRFQGLGLGLKSFKLAMEFGFENLQLKSISAKTVTGNFAMINLLTRLNFIEQKSDTASGKDRTGLRTFCLTNIR